MSDTTEKASRVPNAVEVDALRREVEMLELRARKKAALEALRGERSGARDDREGRKADRAARLSAKEARLAGKA